MILTINKFSCVARKGPRKYFTLKPEDLLNDEEYFTTYDTTLAQNEDEYNDMLHCQVLRNYTLAPVYASLSQGNTIEVFRSTYTIGEHAQISWLEEEMTWVIASQHASLFIRSLDDLEAYNIHPKSPYVIPAKIARFWLKNVDHNIKIDKRTLCATYVDNKEFDSLVHYDRPALIFHAIVENEDDKATCLPIEQSYAFFQRWKLDTAPLSNVGTFTNYEDLRLKLLELHDTISHSTVKDEELGCILYFSEKSNNDEVLSMAKIETLESKCLLFLVKTLRDFWRSREKVKVWDAKLDSDYNQAFQVFMYYLESLHIQDFEGYMAIAQTAFKLLKDDIELYNKLKVDIPSFLEFIYKKLGYAKGSFKSHVLDCQEGDDFKSTPKEDAKIQDFHDANVAPPRQEDAIDRMMKNEYIRKNSKIDYEEAPLEDIIGSQKPGEVPKEKPSKDLKNTTKKKKGKKAKTSRKPEILPEEQTPKQAKITPIKEKTPKKAEKDTELKRKNEEVDALIDEQTPKPRNADAVPEQQVFSTPEPAPEPSLTVFGVTVSPVDSKVV